MPPEPLETPASGGRLIELIQPSIPFKLTQSLHFTGSRVLELLSVRRIFFISKDRICKLIFF